MKPFYSLNDYLKKHFDTKIIKLSLDGGFTCPNRDGTVGVGGCIFCSASGSGDFAGNRHLPIAAQYKAQIELLRSKWSNAKYIAYFQNFTNTHAPIKKLRTLYDEALALDDVVGLAIATRPDCLSDEIIELLAEYHRRTFLWIELGLQSVHQHTADWFNRCYSLQEFDLAMQKLSSHKIKSVSHLILNFPNESLSDQEQSLQYVCRSGVWGVKLQMLNILRGTRLAEQYKQNPFGLFTADEYIEVVSQLLTKIPPHIVIHRLTGDGDKKSLLAPKWVQNKRYILNGIQKYMRENDIYQGKFCWAACSE